MLNSVNLNDKTYDELLAEAIAQIPLYSREWTNYNPSDPGITLLQNLTAFQMLQQQAINDVPEEVRKKLLKLMGYTARENHPAEVLVQAPPEGGPILPAGHQLWSGTIPFETTGEVALQPWGLEAVYAEVDGKYRDLTRILGMAAETAAFPFGRQPQAGNALICVLSGVPEVGEPLCIWLQVAEEELRTPFQDEREIPAFSRIRWQYYTDAGWTDARFQDETMGLLRSGAVKLWLEDGLPVPFRGTPAAGCALRCLLETADFDRTPRLRSLAVHLFPMIQKETRVQCLTYPGDETVMLQGRLAELGNMLVFGKEQEDGPYYLYQQEMGFPQPGRMYHADQTPRGIVLRFDAASAPCGCADAVKVVCFDEEMIHHRLLGPVYGYDGQAVQLDLVENVLAEDFRLVLETTERDGSNTYWFTAPGERGPDGFSYHLRSREAQIVIDHPGAGGYQLLLAGCAVTQGSRGNIRAGAVLEQRGGYDGTETEAQYLCPAPGHGGVSCESAEELRARFSAGMQKTSVAVRTEDYEALVNQTPGLCIHKVKAVAEGGKNLVKVAVKPYTEEELPKLSPAYIQQIQSFLEPHRMLTTRFEICQPKYVPVGVKASLSIRGMTAYARAETERVLREALDYVNGEQNFGEWIRFHEVYQKLSALPFVEAVETLSLFPESRDAVLVGSDIRLDDDSLCYPGTIHLVIREYGR